MTGPHRADIAAVFRRESGRAVSVLVRMLGDISLAEDAVQDAFTTAVSRWPVEGLPPSPAGWIITTARNRARDRLRRESTRDAREAVASQPDEGPDEEHDVRDDTLRLIFTCCHPALAIEARLALTLRLVGGLGTDEIARAFLVPEATLGQRISRAKAKIRDAGIPYRIPGSDELPDRLGSVLAVVYLVFNEGYAATSGPALVRPELCDEAIRLARLLVELLPGEGETLGLLALLLFVDSRRKARVDMNGDLVRLADQDRASWDRSLIEEGRALLRECLRRERPGPYQWQASIQAVHCDADVAADTDWRQLLAIHDQLFEQQPTPVVALNRAVVLAEVEGAAVALAVVESLPLRSYHPWHAVRADLLERSGRPSNAADAWRCAIDLCANEAERRFLEARYAAVKKN